MSIIQVRAHQIGIDTTPTNNFSLEVPTSPNGTMKLARGNSTATTQDILTVDATGAIALGVPLGIASGGTGGTLGAWTTGLGSSTPSAGAYADSTTTMSYYKLGRTVLIAAQINIVTNGTAAASIYLTLPFMPARYCVLSGREDQATGNMLQAIVRPNLIQAIIFTYSNTYPGGNNTRLIISGAYEATT